MELVTRVREAFRDSEGLPPTPLVAFDGFDQLDKESAVSAFSGRTRAEVRDLVGVGPSGIQGLWGIEELVVLEPAALRYFVEPFLLHLLATEFEEPDEFSFWLAYHLSEVVRLRGPDVFTRAQQDVLREIAEQIMRRISGTTDWAVGHREHYSSLLAGLARGLTSGCS